MSQLNPHLTNHVNLLLDASSSMTRRTQELIKVADAQVRYLAERSKVHNQETRISVYSFADKTQCLIWDMDVLRLPSIANLYKPYGWTALRDATWTSLDDMNLIPQKYGDHAFLTYVLTDGAENTSRKCTTPQLNTRLKSLPDNFTVAVLVPDQDGVFEAKRFGFPAANIALWNPDKDKGVSEAVDTISRATESFMVGRKSGIRSSNSLFSMGTDTLNKQTVASTLRELSPDNYTLIPIVPRYHRWEIKDFMADNGMTFELSKAYYMLAKREEVQPHKKVAVYEKKTGKIYTGPEARKLVGLPDIKTRVSPENNPDYDLYIQSTAPNRKLDAYTKAVTSTQLLIMK